MTKLKPCPFCGGRAEQISNYNMHACCLSCKNPDSEYKHTAIQCLCCRGVMMGTPEQWNRRK